MNQEIKVDDQLVQIGVVELISDEQLTIYRGKTSGIIIGLDSSFIENLEDESVIQAYDMNFQFAEDFESDPDQISSVDIKDDAVLKIYHDISVEIATNERDTGNSLSKKLKTKYHLFVQRCTIDFINIFGSTFDEDEAGKEFYEKCICEFCKIKMLQELTSRRWLYGTAEYNSTVDFFPEIIFVEIDKQTINRINQVAKSLKENMATSAEMKINKIMFIDDEMNEMNVDKYRMNFPRIKITSDGELTALIEHEDQSSDYVESSFLKPMY